MACSSHEQIREATIFLISNSKKQQTSTLLTRDHGEANQEHQVEAMPSLKPHHPLSALMDPTGLTSLSPPLTSPQDPHFSSAWVAACPLGAAVFAAVGCAGMCVQAVPLGAWVHSQASPNIEGKAWPGML